VDKSPVRKTYLYIPWVQKLQTSQGIGMSDKLLRKRITAAMVLPKDEWILRIL